MSFLWKPKLHLEERKSERVSYTLAEALVLILGYYLRKVPMTGR